MDFLKLKWAEILPPIPFDFSFLDKTFDRQYKADEKIQAIFSNFGVLAIFISCLGLFGLASFTAEQRTKEIGIRKALGASISGIILMLSKEFTKWVLMANIIAWPIAYLAMNRWLQSFAYCLPFFRIRDLLAQRVYTNNKYNKGLLKQHGKLNRGVTTVRNTRD